MIIKLNGTPEYVLFYETSNTLYYCNVDGFIIQKSKRTREERKKITTINPEGEEVVTIGSKSFSVLDLMINSFFSYYLNRSNDFEVIYRNGNKKDLRVENLMLYLPGFYQSGN